MKHFITGTTEEKLIKIRELVEKGVDVYSDSDIYIVIKDKLGQWMIKCIHNDYCIGLTNLSETKLNGTEFFYIYK
jgi:hypothetical protein